MNTIEIDKDKLTDYLVQNCPAHFYNYAEGDCCMKKVDKQTCSLHIFADDLHCPLDCPRLNTKEHGCDRGRCPRIKNTIKRLKA